MIVCLNHTSIWVLVRKMSRNWSIYDLCQYLHSLSVSSHLYLSSLLLPLLLFVHLSLPRLSPVINSVVTIAALARLGDSSQSYLHLPLSSLLSPQAVANGSRTSDLWYCSSSVWYLGVALIIRIISEFSWKWYGIF
jgi:hypothetical protein